MTAVKPAKRRRRLNTETKQSDSAVRRKKRGAFKRDATLTSMKDALEYPDQDYLPCSLYQRAYEY